MKQKIYILGFSTTMLVFLGAMLKINHLAGASILLTVGLTLFVLVFLPLALRNSYKSEAKSQNKALYIVTWLTCFIVFTGMLFKILHWPLAGYLLLIALPFPYVVFLPVFLFITGKNKKSNITDTVFVFFLMAVVSVYSVFLALNVSKERIDESYNLSGNYIRLENVLKQLPVSSSQNAVNLRIDELIKTVDEYQDAILKHEDLSKEKWDNSPGELWRPDNRQSAFDGIKTLGEPFPGERFEIGLQNLVEEMKRNPGYENFAKSADVLFEYREDYMSEHPRKFENETLSWILIYLDGVKTNLNLIKASVPE
jgi:hypothetical protein